MKPTSRTLSWAFVIILLVVGIFTALGMILMHKQPLVLQGEAEATEIRISGKLPGRIDTFLVQEGDWVRQGDTLVVINSPEVHAKFQQVNALEQVAVLQNKKIDDGTRRQIVGSISSRTRCLRTISNGSGWCTDGRQSICRQYGRCCPKYC